MREFREAWDRIEVCPRTLFVLVMGLAITLLVVLTLARYYGLLDYLGFTCDA